MLLLVALGYCLRLMIACLPLWVGWWLLLYSTLTAFCVLCCLRCCGFGLWLLLFSLEISMFIYCCCLGCVGSVFLAVGVGLFSCWCCVGCSCCFRCALGLCFTFALSVVFLVVCLVLFADWFL